MALTLVNCAKTGSPTGGPQDSIPPVFIKSEPPNYTTNFDGNRIRIYFDEYIKLKDYQKQLIVSPPLENSVISPQGSAAKYVNIEIKDTLEPNTTYVFNFGQSIVDNNESNPFSYFKYVFSTGDYIDSLTVKGVITDELKTTPDDFVSVMLYAVDSTFNDSIIYNERPRYVTNTLDSLTTFEIGNIKEGEYMLIAMKDEDANFTFQPNKDKVGFLKEFITVPTDSSYTLKLFKEVPETKSSRPRHSGSNRITFGISGPVDSVSIDLLTKTSPDFRSKITQKVNSDTLYYWYDPKPEIDSLVFEVTGPKYRDTLVAKLRSPQVDSLRFSSKSGGTLVLGAPFEIGSNIPIEKIQDSLIQVVRDSIPIAYEALLSERDTKLSVSFETEEKTKYTITALPGALTDFFGTTNDTLSYTSTTKEASDYGNIKLTLTNAKNFPYIIQLTNQKGEVIQERYTTEETVFDFTTLKPSTYLIQFIEDQNGNKIYDTGNYLEKRQPEKVIHFGAPIEVNASWYKQENFTFKN
ncbi:Ig-like domain-containing protein [uncultured Dokdonia sp.]|uniref:Ig-like domain-containing protein n=1 Tax=uncultured Dokdonia sp. TaxID=575653 RepID=UPI0026341483|nr:Ig-like domain-containing protein [uncultured Dokdonia sp.]